MNNGGKKAWERELEKYEGARPVDFREDPSDWSGIDMVLAARREHVKMFWDSRVPGSRAPESLYTAMIQAWFNRGYEVSAAEAILDEALEAYRSGDGGALEMYSGRILAALNRAPVDREHPTHATARPETWEEFRRSIPASGDSADGAAAIRSSGIPDLDERLLRGWQGQIAGGSYGTAIEGYTGRTLRDTYGAALDGYLKEPETLNDDITFELAVLKAAEQAITRSRHAAAEGATGLMGPAPPELTADDIADMWLKYIPFGWSAEYFALENLRRGWYPPESGRQGNYFSEWIGAQMRTMVCGFLAPGDPMRAAEYAWMDSSVSHEANGIYAGVHSAVLSSLAFVMDDSRELLLESRQYVPEGSEFAILMDKAITAAREAEAAEGDGGVTVRSRRPDSVDGASPAPHIRAWESFYDDLKTYNWIHAYPNMVAVVMALWFCGNDIGRAFRILADCGADVDCNAGEVGSALGVMFPVPGSWTDPFDDVLETYVPGMEKMTISGLASWTAELARGLES